MSQGFITSFVISVGLNVGDQEPPGQLGRTLAALGIFPLPEFLPEFIRTGASQWNGVPERFVQVRYGISISAPRIIGRSQIIDAVALLARALAQEAIAVQFELGDDWILVRPDSSTLYGGSTAEFPVLV